VSDATLALADTGQVALNLGVRMPDDTYREVFLRAEGFALMRSDGQELDVGKFLKLGEAYWTAFASRSR
jgi:hypothetical protein